MLIHYKGAYGADVLSEGGMNQEQFVAAICGELPWFVTGKRMLFTFRSWTACVARGGLTHVSCREMVLKARMFKEMFGLFDRDGTVGHACLLLVRTEWSLG